MKHADVFEEINSQPLPAAMRSKLFREVWANAQRAGRFDIIDKPLPADKQGTVLAVIVSEKSGPIRIAMTRNEVFNMIEVFEGDYGMTESTAIAIIADWERAEITESAWQAKLFKTALLEAMKSERSGRFTIPLQDGE